MIETTQLLTMAGSLIVALFGVISSIIVWVGSRIINKQDAMNTKLDTLKDEVHHRINNIEIRLVRVETRVNGNE